MPAKHAGELIGTNGISQVMAGAVGHEGDLVLVCPCGFRPEFVQNPADCLDDLEIRALIVPADVVGLAGASLLLISHNALAWSST